MLKKVISILDNICAACVGILTFSVLFQILARIVFHIPATWTTEVGRTMFLAIVFLGLPGLIYRKKLMYIEMGLEAAEKHKVSKIIFHVVIDVCSYFFLITMIYGSYREMIAEWNSAIPTVEWLKYGYLYLIMFVGCLIALYAKAVDTRKKITGK